MKESAHLKIPTTVEDLADPSRTALLIYDMQVGIRRQVKDGDRIVERCAKLIAGARRAGMRIAFTRHLSAPKAWMGVTQYRTAMAWQKATEPSEVKSPFLRSAPSAAIVPELAPTDDDLVIEKYSMSAFEGTPLEFALRDAGLLGIAICGIALEIGIEPTVRHATDLGFVPIVITDACGAGDSAAGDRAFDTMRFIGEAMFSDSTTFAALIKASSS